jgi:hypothetical protein
MSNTIQGNPTKTFFIEMITRDISIKDAILDLLDNSIDGANRLNPDSYEGLSIEITINENEFILKDNCGGFSLEIAQKYAFRFGRPDDAPKTEGSVGRFGVGMKRALFKMGKVFEVETKSTDDHFQVNVDVDNWRNKKEQITNSNGDVILSDDWSFAYTLCDEGNKNIDSNGTFIKVNNLYPEVSNLFKEEYFLNSLKLDIERLLNFSIEKKIIIKLNGQNLLGKSILIFSELSKPYYHQITYKDVNIKIIAGISHTGDPSSAGWYVYCNDRLVLEADKTETTGWGVGAMTKSHPDYAMFRGIVFMDSIDTLNLPLTTTKKGIDSTSEIYKVALYFMKEAMLAVTSFLKKVRNLENPDDYKQLLAEQENPLNVVQLKVFSQDRQRYFSSPSIDFDSFETKNEFVRIAFNADRKEAEKARVHNGAKNYKEFGENIFQYYKQIEGINE